MKKALFCLLMPMLLVSTAQADLVGIWEKCGLGAMIFNDGGDGEYKVLAIVSNITFDLGTTATLSHVSSQESCKGGNASAGRFILETFGNVAQQTAVGEGSHLTAMLNTLGCTAKSHDGIIHGLRQNFSAQIQGDGYSSLPNSEKAKRYYQGLIQSVNSGYADQCAG